MKNADPRIDAYISKSGEFAKPILKHLRKLTHEACPDVEETMKWSFPHFDHKGMMCHMAAFKNHCAFGFWKGSLLKDPDRHLKKIGETAMGQFGKITQLSDLPDDEVLLNFIKQAVKLNDDEVKIPSKPKSKIQKTLEIPVYILDEINKNSKALTTFKNFSYTNKKDYVEWVTSAKTEATREKRLATTVAWLAEGKIRNWKYVKK